MKRWNPVLVASFLASLFVSLLVAPYLDRDTSSPSSETCGASVPAPRPGLLLAATGGGQVPADVDMAFHDANAVWLGISNTGQIGNDLFGLTGAGFWPAGTPNNYVFGSGLWIGGLADLDGDGTKDTVVVYCYDPLSARSEHREGRVGQDPADPGTRIFSSMVLQDLLEWPPEFRDGEGNPIVYSLQDFATIYNDVSGNPIFEAGRCGIEIRQRSMAFIGGLNYNTILVFYELVNRSDSLPDGPYTLEEAYVGFFSDMDIGDRFNEDMTSVLDSVEVYGRGKVEIFTAVAWDSNFVESNFVGDPGFVGVLFLQPPGNPWDGVDNDGDGLVDESPYNGIDDDGDGTPDDIPDEVDAVNDFHYTLSSSLYSGLPPPYDPESDREAYRMMRCLTEESCGERAVASDVRFLITCGSFDLPPGESQITAVAFVFANAVGDPDHVDLFGDPPRPDPEDSVFTEFIATIMSARALYESGFEMEYDRFDILGTTDFEDNNDPVGPYVISTNIIDSVPLARNTLHYSVDGGPYQEVVLARQALNLFGGEIPGQPLWSTVSYFVQAVDSAYQSLRDPEDAPLTTYEFSVLDVPDFTREPCEACDVGTFIAASDFDLDGLADLFTFASDGPALYRNLGGFAFENVAADAGIEISAVAYGASWGDFDNDGYPDLFVASYSPSTPHLLFRNLGNGTFEDVTVEAGVGDDVMTSSGIWGDVNGDGLLDLLTAQYGTDRLYLNNGDGTFTERAEVWGIDENVNDKSAAFFDMDGDSDLDLLLIGGAGNFVYENVDEGRFEDVTQTSGIGASSWQSLATGDYDNDGDVDLLLSGNALTLLENTDGGGTFADVTSGSGLAGLADDASWADLNADGLLDVVTTQLSVFVRKPGDGFVNLTGLSGISPGEGQRSFILPSDLDNDGLLDLVINDFWRNEAYGGYFPRHWLGLRLRGTLSDRSACGGGATVFAGDLSATRWVSGGEGRSQESPVLHFGLDTLTVIDSLVIGWPSGIRQKIAGAGVDRILEVSEDSTLGIGPGDRTPGLPRVFSLSQNFPNPFNPETTIAFDVPGDEGQRRDVSLVIYDMRGRLVKELLTAGLLPGTHRVTWDGKNGRGERVSSGVYLYVLRSGAERFTRKMVVLK
jgi:hypothetical protein